MMLSVLKNTKTPVKFWFLKNYLSPTFKVCSSKKRKNILIKEISIVSYTFYYFYINCIIYNFSFYWLTLIQLHISMLITLPDWSILVGNVVLTLNTKLCLVGSLGNLGREPMSFVWWSNVLFCRVCRPWSNRRTLVSIQKGGFLLSSSPASTQVVPHWCSAKTHWEDSALFMSVSICPLNGLICIFFVVILWNLLNNF